MSQESRSRYWHKDQALGIDAIALSMSILQHPQLDKEKGARAIVSMRRFIKEIKDPEDQQRRSARV